MQPPPEKMNSCNDFVECPSFIEKGILITNLTPLKKFVAMHFHFHNNIRHVNRMNAIKKFLNLKMQYSSFLYFCDIIKLNHKKF